ncbi:hypothetical protein ABBQ38_011292 [Trebouxia sp. C0009 RCD-2024]
MSTRTPQKQGKRTIQEPADLWLYHQSTEKRRRLSMGQTPITPAKAENKPEPSKSAHARQSAEAYRPESPSLELSEGEDTESNIELLPGTRIKVLQQELHQVKQDLFVSQQAFAQAQEEQRQTDKEAEELRKQLRQLTGANIKNCAEDELHELGKLLDRAQGRVAIERTRHAVTKQQASRQAASKLNRRLDW